MAGSRDLIPNYYEHFAIIKAETPDFLDQVHRLRYQVYCVENSFEDPANHPNGLERDDHDAVSAHLLLLHRPSGIAAGTARLIMPAPGDIARSLPIWNVLRPEVRQQFERLPRHETAEISRFAISKEFRNWFRQHHADASSATFGAEHELLSRLIFGLFEHIMYLSIEKKINHLAAIMKPSLMRMVDNLGLKFHAIGEPVEYHGIRQPCTAYIPDLIRRSQREAPPWWRFVSSHNQRLGESTRGDVTVYETLRPARV